ncbi:Inhibitory POU protein [Orchesella cincta]|uniref:Inhibitory POU protein n=1 Tax=Orchesella cincta TaxID=48709 RepID=A0A1D2NDR2_ORCCI|nr:Inhibitory POU protein [Orchesella cincta]
MTDSDNYPKGSGDHAPRFEIFNNKEVVTTFKLLKSISPPVYPIRGAPGAPSYYPTAVAMYSTDKVMNGKPLGSTISAPGSCFPGRYSPTYRGPDPMRRCVNPTTIKRGNYDLSFGDDNVFLKTS